MGHKGHRLAAVAVAVALAIASSHDPRARASTAPAAPSPSRALLHLRLLTTSDWSAVELTGAMGGLRLTANATSTQVVTEPNGVLLRGFPAGGATVDVDAVFEETTGRDPIVITVRKGFIGQSQLTIANRTGQPFEVVNMTNTRQRPYDADNAVSVTRTRSQVFGETDLTLPKADPRRLVLAFYYPWFTGNYSDPRLGDRPVQPTDSRNYDDVLAMTRQAQAAGVDGFLESWGGASRDDFSFRQVQRAAAVTGSLTGLYLETAQANILHNPLLPTDRNVVTAWLDEALDRTSDPTYLRAGGVPVVFVYDMARLPASDWAAILRGVRARGRDVRLVGDATDGAYAAASWGRYRYSPSIDNDGVISPEKLQAWNQRTALDARAPAVTGIATSPVLFAATVSPGYDDRRLRGWNRPWIDRGDGTRYRQTWDAAAAADPDWLLVTSWNEWYETTAIQPGQAWGDRALRQTATFSSAFKG